MMHRFLKKKKRISARSRAAFSVRKRVWAGSLVLLPGMLLFLYAWQWTFLGTMQYESHALEEQQRTLEESVADLTAEIAEAQTAGQLEARIAEMNFVRVIHPEYVSSAELAFHVAVR